MDTLQSELDNSERYRSLEPFFSYLTTSENYEEAVRNCASYLISLSDADLADVRQKAEDLVNEKNEEIVKIAEALTHGNDLVFPDRIYEIIERRAQNPDYIHQLKTDPRVMGSLVKQLMTDLKIYW